MPTVEHSALDDPNIHLPRNVSTASNNQAFLANGSGGGSWEDLAVYGGLYYTDIGTGTSYVAPSSYTALGMTTTDTNLKSFTNSGTGKLTYTGSGGVFIRGLVKVGYTHSTGSGLIYVAAYKNGSILTPQSVTAEETSTVLGNAILQFDDTAVTNDYYEVYIKTSSGDVTVKNFYFSIAGTQK